MFDVMCNVKSIYVDIKNYRGVLELEPNNSPDMPSTIKCFKDIDPEIKRIDVVAEGKLDIVYYIYEGKWFATCYRLKNAQQKLKQDGSPPPRSH